MKTFFLAAAAALITAAPAAAQDPAPLGTPDAFYFDCTGTLPLQTIDVDTYSWSPTAPTASYQSGAGCGWADPLLSGTAQPNPLYDAGFGGQYGGEIRQIELTLFAGDATSAVDGKTINADILVDGESVATFEEVSATDAGGPDAAIGKYTYTFSDLDIPATKRAKSIVIAVQTYNDAGLWLQGASEVPSGVKLYSADDLPEPEPDEEF